MKRKLRVLLLTDEAWNDKKYGNNVHTNWFSQMPVDIANIYRGNFQPINSVCKKYYQLSDSDLFLSILKGGTSGKQLEERDYSQLNQDINMDSVTKTAFRIKNNFIRLLRELMWISKRWQTPELDRFIDDFSPDVIFSARYAKYGFLKIEKYVEEITRKPIIAFTADDEYSLKQIEISISWWINRFMTRYQLKKNAKVYDCYLTFSPEQAKYYSRILKCRTSVIYKSGIFLERTHNENNKILRIIYAGKLYHGRWKTLTMIGRILDRINYTNEHYSLDIYTNDTCSKYIKKLQKNKCINVKSHVSQSKLLELYKEYDLALHVESFNLRDRFRVRFSFSTKIIDCLASGCTVIAICGRDNAGYKYLMENDLALCADKKNDAHKLFSDLWKCPQSINIYRKRAYIFGIKHHNKATTISKMFSILSNKSEEDYVL